MHYSKDILTYHDCIFVICDVMGACSLTDLRAMWWAALETMASEKKANK